MMINVDRPVKLLIDPELCQNCQRCEASKVCRTKAIVQMDPGEQPYIEAYRCRDCWLCIKACVAGAVRKIGEIG